MSAANWGATVARGRTAEISVGRARISRQIEQLSRAADECFAAGYVKLVSCLELQLRDEEAAIESIGGRALRSHQEHHARVLAALSQVEPQIEEGDFTLGREALALLDQWLPAQRASIDMALLIALTPAGRRRPLEERRRDAGRRRLRPASQTDGNPFARA